MTTKTQVEVPVKSQVATDPAAWVSPSELCDQQTRNMAYDAFAVFQSRL